MLTRNLFRGYSRFAECFMSTFDVGNFAVSDHWALPCDMLDIAVNGTVEYHLRAGCVQTSTIIELGVDLLVVGHVDLLSGVHL